MTTTLAISNFSEFVVWRGQDHHLFVPRTPLRGVVRGLVLLLAEMGKVVLLIDLDPPGGRGQRVLSQEQHRGHGQQLVRFHSD